MVLQLIAIHRMISQLQGSFQQFTGFQQFITGLQQDTILKQVKDYLWQKISSEQKQGENKKTKRCWRQMWSWFICIILNDTQTSTVLILWFFTFWDFLIGKTLVRIYTQTNKHNIHAHKHTYMHKQARIYANTQTPTHTNVQLYLIQIISPSIVTT